MKPFMLDNGFWLYRDTDYCNLGDFRRCSAAVMGNLGVFLSSLGIYLQHLLAGSGYNELACVTSSEKSSSLMEQNANSSINWPGAGTSGKGSCPSWGPCVHIQECIAQVFCLSFSLLLLLWVPQNIGIMCPSRCHLSPWLCGQVEELSLCPAFS